MNPLRQLFGWERRHQLWRAICGEGDVFWNRIVMNKATGKLIAGIGPESLSAVELSGDSWSNAGFKSYTSLHYPEFDICQGPLPEKVDVVLANQVWEHLLWPYRAAKHVRQSLNPGGYFLLSTPFLVRVHNEPVDCTRWTEVGLKYFLLEAGFTDVQTGSWGNRECLKADLEKWTLRRRWHSLENEPEFPVTVWALAS